MNKFGLTHRQMDVLKKIFSDSQISTADIKVFGSRAMGTYLPHSDVDLVIFGAITQKEINRLWTLFAESSIPNKIDICAYQLIKTPALKKHIDTFAQPLNI